MKKILILVLLSLFMCSCVAEKRSFTIDKNYKRTYGHCPTYPAVKHYRALSKKINPEYCNFVH